MTCKSFLRDSDMLGNSERKEDPKGTGIPSRVCLSLTKNVILFVPTGNKLNRHLGEFYLSPFY
jgi:hypothetical protein